MKNQLDMLCAEFGNHYGSSFNLLGTYRYGFLHEQNYIKVKAIADGGNLSPKEIHNLLQKEQIDEVGEPVSMLMSKSLNYLHNQFPEQSGANNLDGNDKYWEMVDMVRIHFDTDISSIYGELGEEIVRNYINQKLK